MCAQVLQCHRTANPCACLGAAAAQALTVCDWVVCCAFTRYVLQATLVHTRAAAVRMDRIGLRDISGMLY